MELRDRIVFAAMWLVVVTAIMGQVRSLTSQSGMVALASHQTTIALQLDGSAITIEHIVPAGDIAKLQWSTAITYPGTVADEPRVVKIIDVTDGDDHPLRFTTHPSLHWLDLNIASAGAKEIRVMYEVQNAVRFLRDRDELVWTAGDGWRGPVAQSSIAIEAPEEAASLLTAQASASQGARIAGVSRAEVEGTHVSLACPGPLMHHQYCVADVVLPKGVLEQRGIATRAVWWLRANPVLFLPIVVFGVMAVARMWKRQPSAKEFSVAPEYDLPKDVTPAEAGVLIDDSVDPRDVVATLFDLAVRGYIKMEKCKPDEDVAFQGQDYTLRLVKPVAEWQGLASYERATLFHLFYGGQWTKLSSLHLRFYSVIPIIRGELLDGLRRKGFYRFDPDRASVYRQALMLVVVGLLITGQLVGLFSITDSPLLSLIAVALSGAVVWWYGRDLTPKTVRGMRVWAQVRGLQEFMSRVEGDRLKRIPPEEIEKSLPYAIALGVEHHWANAFSGIVTAPPQWLTNVDDTFDSAQFLQALDSFAREARRTLLTRPRAGAAPEPFPKNVKSAVKGAAAGSA